VTGRFTPVLFTFCIENATTPILGAVLLAFSIDTRLAKNDVKYALDAAKDRSLTIEMYQDVRLLVKKRERRWRSSSYRLLFVALYCTVGLVFSLGYIVQDQSRNSAVDDDNNDDTLGIFFSNSKSSDILLDVIIASELGKESILLFVFLFLVMGVNDTADSITSVLIAGRWGEPSDPAEVVRAHLIFLNTVYSTTPSKLESWFNFFTKSIKRPISFVLMGVRITREFVVAALVSLLLAMSNSLSSFIKLP